jgi:hypothetical protein
MDAVRDCSTNILRAIAAKAFEGELLYWATAEWRYLNCALQ